MRKDNSLLGVCLRTRKQANLTTLEMLELGKMEREASDEIIGRMHMYSEECWEYEGSPCRESRCY